MVFIYNKENVARWDFQKSKVVFKNGVIIFYNDQIESVKGSHRFIDSLFVNNAVVKNNIDVRKILWIYLVYWIMKRMDVQYWILSNCRQMC